MTRLPSNLVLSAGRAWQRDLIAQARAAARGDEFWEARLRAVQPTLHLAVLVEPYLQWILAGRKSVESRFSRHRRPPFQSVHPNDALLLKRSSGAVLGSAVVVEAHYYELTPATLRRIRGRFAADLCAPDDDFWRQREVMRFASLFRLAHVCPLPPIVCAKRDRRAWVVLDPTPR